MVIFYELYVGKEDCEKCCSCMHSPQHSQVTGGGATITQNQCRECDHLCPAGKKMHTGLRFSSTDCDVTLQDSCLESSLRYKCVFGFHSRFVKIWRVERLRVVGCVCVERVAVVQSVRLPRSLVLGKVPASGELGLQSLWGDVNKENDDAPLLQWKDRDFLRNAQHGNERETEIWLLEARAQRKEWLTPTFRSKSLTMLRADILAEGVSGELPPYPFDRATGGERGQKKRWIERENNKMRDVLMKRCSDIPNESKKMHSSEDGPAATCWVGKGVVQTFAQWGSGEREGGLYSSVHLYVVLCGRAWSRHPAHIGLPLSDGQLLPQVYNKKTKTRGTFCSSAEDENQEKKPLTYSWESRYFKHV